jgi:O-antigen/teichoic acid export membrane protein
VSAPTAPSLAARSPGAQTRAYGRGTRVLSAGIAVTGLVTFAFFSLASHALDEVQYKGISLLWAVMFLIISVIYRPVEQLLSRTISVRRAQGLHGGHPLRVALAIQLAFAALFALAAAVRHDWLVRYVFDGSATLYRVLVVAVLAFAASYFARGWLAGHERFALYGGLVLLESCSRCLFALLAAVGIAHGQGFVALGIAAAPVVSLVVVPLALLRADPPPGTTGAEDGAADGRATGDSLRGGASFAGAVLVVMAAEQALLNGPILLVDYQSSNAALAGFAFNALLITRAPLQLFQAVQTTLLPHLSGLSAVEGEAAFRHTLRTILLAVAAFAAVVVLALAALGPWAMGLLFGGDFHYARGGLVLVGVGMGLHLASATLNQAALARGRAAAAAAAWLGAAGLFLAWLAVSPLQDELLAVEAGYALSTAALAAALWRIEARRPGR